MTKRTYELFATMLRKVNVWKWKVHLIGTSGIDSCTTPDAIPGVPIVSVVNPALGFLRTVIIAKTVLVYKPVQYTQTW